MSESPKIHRNAAQYLRNRSRERSILEPFLKTGFEVTWARELVFRKTRLTVCFLKPDRRIIDAYGFEYEIVLAYSPYPSVEPRSLQAVDDVFLTDPGRGRVEPMLYFLVSEAKNVVDWVSSYLTEHRESRIVVPFRADQLADQRAGEWTIRNQLHHHFLLLDRFKYTLPLREDTYFFGRIAEVGKILELTRRSENAGLFGLRKTGKTSVLLKIKRLLEADQKHAVEVIDAQSPAVRRRHWNELLEYIARQILARIGESCRRDFTELDAADQFKEVIVRFLNSDQWERLTLAFDEIEWLTPSLARDRHWDNEFLDLWQVIRSTQTTLRGFNIVVAGVNPSIAEQSRFGNHQNPLFGILTPVFLRGLTVEETGEMIQKIGKIMGLSFTDDAVTFLMEEYAGHPLLTRLACSSAAELAKGKKEAFPVRINRRRLEADSNLRDGELVFYVRHVVDELERFYPEEYSLLEKLATDDYQGFTKGTMQTHFAAHLFRYGVVSDPQYPFITYAVLKDYVARENARREGRPWKYKLVPAHERKSFIGLRMREVVEDLRNLERLIKQTNQPSLYGPNSFPEAEKLFDIVPPELADDLGSALSVLNRCLVESIDRYGESVKQNEYFWSKVKDAYPDLHKALHRIRVYRHNSHHLELRPMVEKALRSFLEEDLDDALAASTEKHWALFQRCLDELFQAIQRETAKLELIVTPSR